MPQAHSNPVGWNSSIDNDPLDWNAPHLIPRSPRNLISQAEWTQNTTLSTATGSQPPGWQFDICEDPIPLHASLHVRFPIDNDLVEPKRPRERWRPPSPAILDGSTDAQEIMHQIECYPARGRVIISNSDSRITPHVVIPCDSAERNSRRSRSERVSRSDAQYASDSPIARDA